MRAWLATQRSWLVVERLPGYAPELNPVEGLWANFRGKGGELANLAGDTLDEVIAAATRGADRVRQTPHLPYSFLRRCGVSLWQPCHSKLQTSLSPRTPLCGRRTPTTHPTDPTPRQHQDLGTSATGCSPSTF